jgi:outer membrane protein OmpA-like peptidoglycan-associated protein
MKKVFVLAILSALLVTSCATTGDHTTEGAVVGTATGAGLGAALGYAIGGTGHSAAIGAAAGAVAGGLTGAALGNYMDQQEEDLRRTVGNSEYTTVRRERETIYLSFRSDVLFDSGSARLRSGAYAELDRVAQVLHNYPETRIIVEGHTDAVGGYGYNMELSQRRAEVVADDLIQQGVNPRRVETYGYGPTRPVASNNSNYGRQMNRRVDVTIVPLNR